MLVVYVVSYTQTPLLHGSITPAVGSYWKISVSAKAYESCTDIGGSLQAFKK
jgi:hypothetical protein